MWLLARAAFVATIFLDAESGARTESRAREAEDAAFGEARKKATAQKRGRGEAGFLSSKKIVLRENQIEQPIKHFGPQNRSEVGFIRELAPTQK